MFRSPYGRRVTTEGEAGLKRINEALERPSSL